MKTNNKSKLYQLEAHDEYNNIPNLILKHGSLDDMISLMHKFGNISEFELHNSNEDFPNTIGDDENPTVNDFVVNYLEALKRNQLIEFYSDYMMVRELYAKLGYEFVINSIAEFSVTYNGKLIAKKPLYYGFHY
jgi:hypothetical protein